MIPFMRVMLKWCNTITAILLASRDTSQQDQRKLAVQIFELRAEMAKLEQGATDQQPDQAAEEETDGNESDGSQAAAERAAG